MGKNKRTKTRDLERDVDRDTRTVDLMDEFEGIGEKYCEPYDRLIIADHVIYVTKQGFIKFRYVIERLEIGKLEVGDITFTKWKNNIVSNDLNKYVMKRLNEANVKLKTKDEIEIKLDPPFLLRAQSSRNRSGYGLEVTEYGETTKYGIVGVRVSKHF